MIEAVRKVINGTAERMYFYSARSFDSLIEREPVLHAEIMLRREVSAAHAEAYDINAQMIRDARNAAYDAERAAERLATASTL